MAELLPMSWVSPTGGNPWWPAASDPPARIKPATSAASSRKRTSRSPRRAPSCGASSNATGGRPGGTGTVTRMRSVTALSSRATPPRGASQSRTGTETSDRNASSNRALKITGDVTAGPRSVMICFSNSSIPECARRALDGSFEKTTNPDRREFTDMNKPPQEFVCLRVSLSNLMPTAGCRTFPLSGRPRPRLAARGISPG